MINGCDAFWDGVWRHCCNEHDVAYTLGGSFLERISADIALGWCVATSDWWTLPVGIVMATGTLAFGWLFFRFEWLSGGRNLTERRAVMPVSLRLIRYIGGHEGKVLKAYRDPVHVITIGYGFTWGSVVFRQWWTARRGRKLQMGDTMTEQEALEVLKLLIETEYAPPVERKFAGKKINVIEGGTDTCYNAGPGSLKWKWAEAIVRGDISGGARLLRTTAVTGRGSKKPLPGLVRRRNETADIIEFDKWPNWTFASTKVDTHTDTSDIAQAQTWLATLGYSPGAADGIVGQRTINATRRFQQDHGQLAVDGKIGPATMSALKRTMDLRSAAGKTVGTTAGSVAAGTAEGTTGAGDSFTLPPDAPVSDLGWVGDLLIWGGLALGVVVLVYLAWRYKDEINTITKRLF